MGAPFFDNSELQAQLRLGAIEASTATLLAELASDAVRNELEQLIDYVVDDQITVYGDGSDLIVLPERPVISVSHVLLDGVAIPRFLVVNNSAVQRIVYPGSQYASASSMRWPYGVPVTITYTHGYQEPPPIVKIVALELAAAAYTVNDTVDDANYVRTSMRFTPEQRARLDKYRYLNV